MEKRELIKRYLFFLAGLFFASLGVSCITKADLGTSPISSIPYVLSLGFTPTIGQFTIVLSILLILGQMLILKRDFKKYQLLQIPISVLFGYFIDITMIFLRWVHPEVYYMKLLFLLCGCVILGFGVFMEVLADVVMLPGEAFVNAVSTVYHREFGSTKVAFDASMTVIAGGISAVMFHGIQGVREGTIAAAVVVGMIARFFLRKLGFMENMLRTVKKEADKKEKITVG